MSFYQFITKYLSRKVYSYGRASIHFTGYRHRNRAFERRFDEAMQTADDYLIYYRWYRYQSIHPVIAACKHSFPIIRKSRYRIAFVHRGYGIESYDHQRSREDLADCRIFSSAHHLSAGIFRCDDAMIRYDDLRIFGYRICLQQHHRGLEALGR